MSAHLARLNQLRARLSQSRAIMKDKAEAATQAVLTVGIAGGTAYGFGVVKGKFGPVEIAGVPLEAAAGVALLGAAAFGAFGKYSSEAVAAAAGAACSYTHTMGAAHGAKLGTSSAVRGLTSAVAGVLSSPKASISSAETDELVRAAQAAAA